MHNQIMVLTRDPRASRELGSLLKQQRYVVVLLHSPAELQHQLRKDGRQIVVVDLDTSGVDNRLFRELKRYNQQVCIIGISSRPFHPELKEAMSSHIYASLTKPVDYDELIYWLRSIRENDAGSKHPSAT